EQSFNEGPGPADSDLTDDESTDTSVCPACGGEVYEDADRCPQCGEWIVPDHGPSSGARLWWWLGLALAAAGLLLWSLL
ncbi:MAG: hypothetical protein ACLFVW_09840, partial [Phycisphaerae bacterium]